MIIEYINIWMVFFSGFMGFAWTVPWYLGLGFLKKITEGQKHPAHKHWETRKKNTSQEGLEDIDYEDIFYELENFNVEEFLLEGTKDPSKSNKEEFKKKRWRDISLFFNVFLFNLAGALTIVALFGSMATYDYALAVGLMLGTGIAACSVGIHYQYLGHTFGSWAMDVSYQITRFIIICWAIVYWNTVIVHWASS